MAGGKGIAHISSGLRKVNMENRLLVWKSCPAIIAIHQSGLQELLPSTRQTPGHFDSHFEKEGLSLLVKFRRAQENASFKKVLREEIDELIQQEANNEEIIDVCKERMKSTSLTDIDVTVMVGS